MVDLRRWIGDAPLSTHAARTIAALAQCATVWITWKLWLVRTSPPNLPLGPTIALPFGHALIATALLAVIAPRVGAVLHAIVLAVAIAADLTRVQPASYCFAILLLATAFGASATALGRLFLASLWFYAGFNKLLSHGWFTGTAPWLLTAIVKHPTPWVSKWFPWVIAAGELSLGPLALIPRTRKLAALGAIALHVGILVDLGPWGHNWNRAVWPWNLGLALAAPLLLWPWHGEAPRETAARTHKLALGAGLALLIAPALWHVGMFPAYFAHHLYSEDLPTARWCTSDSACSNERGNDEVYAALQVPLSPSVPIIRAHFLARCQRGETLIIEESRRWFVRRGQGRITVPCAQ